MTTTRQPPAPVRHRDSAGTDPTSTYQTPRPTYVDAPIPVDDQDALRQRRHQWLCVHYGASFDLAAEVSAICEPLAAQVAGLPDPLELRRRIEDLADGVHEVASAVVALIAESRHLSPDAAARTRVAISDLARRPREPQIGDEQIADGSWAVLTRHVEPFAADLAAVLGRAAPPDSPALRGAPSASERLEAVLRVLDQAALELAHRLPKAAARQALGSFADHQRTLYEQHEAEAIAQKLARLGLTP